MVKQPNFLKNLLKNGLVTASSAAIVLGSSGALGAPVNWDVNAPGGGVGVVISTAGANLNLTPNGAVPLPVGRVANTFAAGDSLTLTGDINLSTGSDLGNTAGPIVGITAVNSGLFNNWTFTFGNMAVVNGDLDANVTMVNGNVMLGNVINTGAGAGVARTVTVNGGHLVSDDIDGTTTVNNGRLNAANVKAITVNGGAAAHTVKSATDVTVTAGTLNVTAGITGDLTVNGGTLTAGAADIGGIFTIKNAPIVTVQDVTGAGGLTVPGGNITVNDVTAGPVNVAGGTLTMHDATSAGHDVTVTAGVLNINNVGRDLLFAGNATVNVADTGVIARNVDNTTGGHGIGILHFVGGGQVNGTIGATKTLALISIDGNDTKRVLFKGNVNAAQVVFNDTTNVGPGAPPAWAAGGASATAEFQGNLTANVIFNPANVQNKGGVLVFSGAGPYTFDGTITNGGHGSLYAQTNLTAAKSSIGTLNKIYIGVPATVPPAAPAVAQAKTFTIDAADADVTISHPNQIYFLDVKSVLHLTNAARAADHTIIANNNLLGGIWDPTLNAGAGGYVKVGPVNKAGGIVELKAVGHKLTLKSSTGAQTFGTNDNKLSGIRLNGDNIIVIDGAPGSKLDISNVNFITTHKGVTLLDESATSGNIKVINIGKEQGAGTGPATHIIDVKYAAAAVNLLSVANATVRFYDEAAVLRLQNTGGAADKVITLNGDLLGGVWDPTLNVGAGGYVKVGPANKEGGIVELRAADGRQLTIKSDNGTRKLGTNDNWINELRITGNSQVIVAGIPNGQPGANKLDISKTKTLSVYKGATLLDESATSATIPAIGIGVDDGTGPGAATYVLDLKNGLVVSDFLRAGGASPKFHSADSVLRFQNTGGADRTITFNAGVLGGVWDPTHGVGGGYKLDGGGPNLQSGGIVELKAVGQKLILQSFQGQYSLGTINNKLQELRITGDNSVVIHGKNAGAAATKNKLDVTNINKLSIYAGATLVDESATSAAIPAINIGTDAGVGVGAAHYVLDAKNVDFNLPANTIQFYHADAVLKLQNTAAANKTITLTVDLAAGVWNGAQFTATDGGIVEINSAVAGKTLTIANAAAFSLGAVGPLAGGAVGAPVQHKLKRIIFSGLGTIDVSAIQFNANDVQIQVPNLVAGDIDSNITFNAVGQQLTVNNIKGNVDFNNKASKLTLADTGTITGNVYSTGGVAGTLVFDGAGTVTGPVGNNGAADLPIDTITSMGDDTKQITFENNVRATNLVFNNTTAAGGGASAEIDLAGNLTANVTFNPGNPQGGILVFNGAGGPYTFDGTITQGDNGNLYAQTNLTATKSSIGTLNKIYIGVPAVPAVPGPATPAEARTFTINASNADVNIENPNQVYFLHADSVLQLTNAVRAANHTITIANNDLLGGVWDPTAGAYLATIAAPAFDAGGIVELNAVGGHNLILQSDDGTRALGTANNQLQGLRITGTGHNLVTGGVIIRGIPNGVVGENKLDISNTGYVHVQTGAKLLDESATSAQIAVYIGGDFTGAAGAFVAGASTYALDAVNGDFNLPGNNVNFSHEDSVLKLQNTENADHIITLANDLVAGVYDGITQQYTALNGGVVELYNKNAANSLTINNGGGFSLGADGLPVGIAAGGAPVALVPHKLKKIIYSGNGTIQVNVPVNALETDLNIPNLTLGNVTSDISFLRDTQLTADNITGNIDFNNKAGQITITAGNRITGHVTSAAANGTIIFAGAGSLTGQVTNLTMLRAGAAGDVTLKLANGVDNTIAEIQGNGPNNIIFDAQGNNNVGLVGGINLTGGNPVNLQFVNGTTLIAGTIGTLAHPVGNITVGSAGGDAKVVFVGNIKATDISKNAAAGNADVKFVGLNPAMVVAPVIINSNVGAMQAINVTAIGNVTIQGNLTANELILDDGSILGGAVPRQNTTLTIQGKSTIGRIEAAQDMKHTLAIEGDFETTAAQVAAANKRLKAIQLQGNHKVTIKSTNFFSGVTTKTGGQGSVIFAKDGAFAYGVGEEAKPLAAVTFDASGEVRGGTYAKRITINTGKTASFNSMRPVPKTLPVKQIKVGSASLDRIKGPFSYKTTIISADGIFATGGIAQYMNASYINSPITKGVHKFNDNVWLAKPIKEAEKITFADKKIAILENDIESKEIIANGTTIIVLKDDLKIKTPNLSGSNMTMDLGLGKTNVEGNVTLKDNVGITTYYDTTAKKGGSLTVQNGNFDVTAVQKMTVKVVARSNVSEITDDTKYPVIMGNIVGAKDNMVQLDTSSEQSRFVRWTWGEKNGTLYVTAQDISPQVIADDIKQAREEKKPEAASILEVIQGKDVKGDVAKTKDNWSILSKEQMIEAADTLSKAPAAQQQALTKASVQTAVDVANIMSNTIATVTTASIANIGERSTPLLMPSSAPTPILTPAAPAAQPAETKQGGVGAGDEDISRRYGAWVSPFVSTATQKMRKEINGYKARGGGGTFGFDTLINDNILVGAAFTHAETKLKHKNNFGDTTKADTNIFSLYGLYNFYNNYFVEGIASYGITDLKNNEGRIVSVAQNTIGVERAAADYKSRFYTGQISGGRSFGVTENVSVIPTAGLRYSKFKDSAYTETGTTSQNLSFKGRSYDKVEGLAGIRVLMNSYINNILVIPQIQAMINYDFKGKSPKVDARWNGIDQPLPTKSIKPSKTTFNLGAALTAKQGMMEYGISYNASIAKKYLGHQGSLKLRVNF